MTSLTKFSTSMPFWNNNWNPEKSWNSDNHTGMDPSLGFLKLYQEEFMVKIYQKQHKNNILP